MPLLLLENNPGIIKFRIKVFEIKQNRMTNKSINKNKETAQTLAGATASL